MDDKSGLDEELRRGLCDLSDNAGECPPADVLEAYARGGLPTGEKTAIQKHLNGCGICELVVQRLHALEPPDWKSTEKRLRKGLGIPSDAPPAWRRILWNPAPAYALAAVLAITLCVARRTAAPTPAVTPASHAAMTAPMVLKLEPETRGGVPATHPEGRGHSDAVLLMFFVPIQEGSTYSATVLTASGAAVVPKQNVASQDRIGNFYLTCDGRSFGAGDYVLRVTESGGENRTLDFPFSMQ